MKKPIDPPRTCQEIEGGTGTPCQAGKKKSDPTGSRTLYHSLSVDHALDTVLFARNAGRFLDSLPTQMIAYRLS
jgi:hypothetical protein